MSAEEAPDPRELEEVRAAVLDALRLEGLDTAHADDVVRYVFDTSEIWRSCCGGFCEPCVSSLARAVDRVRRARASRG